MMPSKRKSDLEEFCVKKKGSKKGRIACEECGKTLASPWGLDAHIKTVHGQKNFECEYCDKAFARKDHLVNHQRSIHTGSKQCTQCNSVFSGREGLARHVQERHPDLLSLPRQPGAFQCQICNRGFASKYKLKQHSQLVHNVVLPRQERPKKAEEPVQMVVTLPVAPLPPSNVNTKFVIVPPTASNAVSMSQTFNRAPVVVVTPAAQTISHLPALPPPVVRKRECICPVCKNAFADPETLKKHAGAKHPERAHNLEILYKCPYCSGTFLQDASLDTHIQSFHSEQSCLICGSGFFGSQSIARHIRECHGPKKMIIQNVIRYFCDCCQGTFENATVYEDHVLQKHTWSNAGKVKSVQSAEEEQKNRGNGVVLLICEFCDQLFANEAHKDEHLREFHPFKEQGLLHYQCEMCESLFSTQGQLDEHIGECHQAPPHLLVEGVTLHQEEQPKMFLQYENVYATIKEEERFKCHECNDVFFEDAIALERHVSTVHPIPDDLENGSIKVFFQCTLCDDLFQDSGALEAHSQTFHHNNTLINGVVSGRLKEEELDSKDVKRVIVQVTGNEKEQGESTLDKNCILGL